MALKDPLIIIGMHRSGTSLVAKVLEKAGIFMGVFKDHNYEALHFLSLNQQSLWAAGASWLEPRVPDPLYYKSLPTTELYREHFRAQSSLNQWWLKLRQPEWGWKDPRNTFTLPMWLEQFPNARVLHVHREVEAVAHSLQQRNHLKGEVFDERLEDLEFNRQLAQQYQEQAFSYESTLGARYCAVAYEDLIAGKAESISRLEKFCQRPLADLFKRYSKPAN